MLKNHEFYVYHEGSTVFARAGNRSPVILQTFDTPQEAHDKVQSIINPTNKQHQDFGPDGFLSEEFQLSISDNCRAAVEAAYQGVK